MHQGLRTVGGWLAIVAIALHALLFGLAPMTANAALGADPFAVICHGGGDTGTDQAPSGDGLVPSHACEHCKLCGAVGAAAGPDLVIVSRLLPERVLAVLSSARVPPRTGITSDPKLPRGPPHLM